MRNISLCLSEVRLGRWLQTRPTRTRNRRPFCGKSTAGSAEMLIKVNNKGDLQLQLQFCDLIRGVCPSRGEAATAAVAASSVIRRPENSNFHGDDDDDGAGACARGGPFTCSSLGGACPWACGALLASLLGIAYAIMRCPAIMNCHCRVEL